MRGAIVVGVDRSIAGQQAVTWAADEAALQRRRLVLAHATGSLGTTGTVWLDSMDSDITPALQDMRAEGLALVSAAPHEIRSHHPELEIELAVEPDDAGPALRALADQAHLLVVGSRGRGLLRHLPTWQVGARVARSSRCPVAVVPEHDLADARRGVLVGADLSERSASVLHFAYEFASRHNLPLTVAHLARERRESSLDDAKRLLTESVSGFAERHPDVPMHLSVKHGSPTLGLLAQADTMDVLVLGQHHALGTYESPVRHVHTSIVDRATCPVVVVPQTETRATRKDLR